MRNKMAREEKDLADLSLEVESRFSRGGESMSQWVQVVSLVSGVLGLVLSAVGLFVKEDVLQKIIGWFGFAWAVTLIISGAVAMHAIRMLRERESFIAATRKVQSDYEDDLKRSYARLDRAYGKTNDASYLAFTELTRSVGRVSYSLDDYFEKCEELQRTKDLLDNVGNSNKKVSKWHSEELKKASSNFKRTLLDEYGRFIISSLNRAREMIETYLAGKGRDLTVSVTLKMYIRPLEREEANRRRAEMNVYTAFRDTKTYESAERNENPKRLYSVSDNSDFAYCVDGHNYYIFNRAEEKTPCDYRNENHLGGGLYNAGATAIVVTEGTDMIGASVIYGFLACDVLNKEYDDAIDKNVAYILMFIASMIADYCSHVEYVWAVSSDDASEDGKTVWDIAAKEKGHIAEDDLKRSRQQTRQESEGTDGQL